METELSSAQNESGARAWGRIQEGRPRCLGLLHPSGQTISARGMGKAWAFEKSSHYKDHFEALPGGHTTGDLLPRQSSPVDVGLERSQQVLRWAPAGWWVFSGSYRDMASKITAEKELGGSTVGTCILAKRSVSSK